MAYLCTQRCVPCWALKPPGPISVRSYLLRACRSPPGSRPPAASAGTPGRAERLPPAAERCRLRAAGGAAEPGPARAHRPPPRAPHATAAVQRQPRAPPPGVGRGWAAARGPGSGRCLARAGSAALLLPMAAGGSGGAERPYDLVVFGASGFTGQFVVEEVARTAADGELRGGLRWAVAGRSRQKLQAVLERAAERLGTGRG